jgi:hypothetical protein
LHIGNDLVLIPSCPAQLAPRVSTALRFAEREAALTNCRVLINQIEAGLSVKKLFLNISSAAELLFYLEFAAFALKKAAPRPRKRE